MDIRQPLRTLDIIRKEDLHLSEKQITVLVKLIKRHPLDDNDKALLRKLTELGFSFNLSGVDHKTNKKDFFANSCLFDHTSKNLGNLREDIQRLKRLSQSASFPGIVGVFFDEFGDRFEEHLQHHEIDGGDISMGQIINVCQRVERRIDLWFQCPKKETCPEQGYRELCPRQKIWNNIVYQIMKVYLAPGGTLEIGENTTSLKNTINFAYACGIRIDYKKREERRK